MTTRNATSDGLHAPGSTCDCLTPKVVWRTAWGWRARRIPGVFFPNESAALDAYIAHSAEDVVITQEALDELAEIVREAEAMVDDLDERLGPDPVLDSEP